jgi:hypothetical protein
MGIRDQKHRRCNKASPTKITNDEFPAPVHSSFVILHQSQFNPHTHKTCSPGPSFWTLANGMVILDSSDISGNNAIH